MVSLSFDDGWDTQQAAQSALASHGMVGTFYVNSGLIGAPGRLTWAQLDAFNAAGNEIGGHTVDHPDLTTMSAADAQAEICNDRTTILNHGFIDNSFAYPFGGYDENTGSGPLDVAPLVQACGYASGRGAFGLHNILAPGDVRPYSTSIPPPDRFRIPVPCCINYKAFGGSTPTAAALENYVQQAQGGGGGSVQFFFHRLCDNCGGDSPAPSMSPTEFGAFLDWLQSNGIVVETVGQVISGDAQAPISAIACGGTSCSSGWYGGPVTVSLSAADVGSGVAMIHYTTDGSDPTVASPTYTAPFTVAATATVKYRAWDNAGNVEPVNSRLIQVDTAAPVSSIACNGSTCSSGWYGGAVSVGLSATDSQSGVSVIRYTTDGSDPDASSPAYAAPLTVGTTTTVKYRAWDNVGNVEPVSSQLIQIDTTAPVSSISCGSTCSSAWYGSAVSVSLSATDSESGVAVIRYTTDGSDPTVSSPAYAAPLTIGVTTTVKYRAWDNAGNVEPVSSQLIQVDTTAPVSSIGCNGSTCSSGWYNAPVRVTLSSTDSQSGVSVIRYTTDGSDPNDSSPAYAAAFTVSAATTVKYRAWDNVGNVEAVNSQSIQFDTAAPSSAISCNGAACQSWYGAATIAVALSATDTGGSGLQRIVYTINGSDPSLSNGTTYTAPFNVSTATTVKYRAYDNAGNAEPINSKLIQFDTTAPSLTIACNAAPCVSWYSAAVAVSIQAADSQSGVGQIRYTTDGSTPTLTNGTAYSGPFTVTTNTTVKYRAWDNVGNASGTGSQTLSFDTTAPTVTITSPANGATVAGNVNVSANAADTGGSGLASVSFYLDGTTLLSTEKGPKFSFQWNAKTTTKGQHTLTAVATDKAGNRTTSGPVTVTVK